MTNKIEGHNIKPELSVNEVHQRLSKLEKEFESLLKTTEARNPMACDSIARNIRLYLHQARVLLLCTNVNDAMGFLDVAQKQMQQIQTMLVQS